MTNPDKTIFLNHSPSGLSTVDPSSPQAHKDHLLFDALNAHDEALALRALACGADPAARLDGWTALNRAVFDQFERGVEILAPLLPPDHFDRATTNGLTALMWAAYGAPDIARILLDRCDPRVRDADGQDALMIALLRENYEAAALLAPVSDLSAVDRHGRTALIIAAYPTFASCPAIVATLACGCDPLAANDMGMTALMLAAARGDAASLAILLPVSDLAATDHEGRSAKRHLEAALDAPFGLLAAIDPGRDHAAALALLCAFERSTLEGSEISQAAAAAPESALDASRARTL